MNNGALWICSDMGSPLIMGDLCKLNLQTEVMNQQ